MKTVALCIVFAACIALTAANGRGMYMGKYGIHHGRRCAINCESLPPGNHPSCTACNMYVTCVFGTKYVYERICPSTLEWDDNKKICNWPTESTCHNMKI